MADQGPILASGMAQIDAMLAQVPEGKRAALVVASRPGEPEIVVGFAAKLDHGWDVSAEVSQALARRAPDVRFAVRKVW